MFRFLTMTAPDLKDEKNRVGPALFGLRCFLAVVLSYELASAAGLPYPYWAPISAIVVSQERIGETRTSLVSRVIGTIFGAVVAVAIGKLAPPLGIDVATQAAVAVGVCALLAYQRPSFRTSLVTGPIVLLSAPTTDPIEMVGFFRGSEVIIGGLVGGGLHYAMDRMAAFLDRVGGKQGNAGASKITPEE
jgi:uncharacterized membrane protein YccC